MASPPFRAASSLAISDSSGNLTVSKPAGVVDGDFMLMVTRSIVSDSSVSTPSGWTAINSYENSSINQTDLLLFYRVASSEGSSYSVTNSGSATENLFIAQVLAWENATFDVSSKTTTNTGAASITCPSVTMSAANQTLICVYGQYGNGWVSAPYTEPSGMTERSDQTHTSVFSSKSTSFGVADVAVASSGATGSKTATATDGSPWTLAVSIGIASASSTPAISGPTATATLNSRTLKSSTLG